MALDVSIWSGFVIAALMVLASLIYSLVKDRAVPAASNVKK